MNQRFILSKDSKKIFELIKQLKIRCTITLTTYTAEIKSENNTFKQVKNEKSKKTFILAAQIKKDIMDGLQYNLFEDIKEIPFERIEFYSVGNLKQQTKNVYCLDIRNAYATVLLNNGFIKKKTFDLLLSSNKENRLASIGSLAAKKHIFEMEDGKIISAAIIKSEKEKYFWFCCVVVQNLMNELASIAGEFFLYSWVDCLYISSNIPVNKLNEIQLLIRDKKYDYRLDIAKNFHVTENNRTFHVSFEDEKNKTKIFRFPKKNDDFVKAISSLILKGKYFN